LAGPSEVWAVNWNISPGSHGTVSELPPEPPPEFDVPLPLMPPPRAEIVAVFGLATVLLVLVDVGPAVIAPPTVVVVVVVVVVVRHTVAGTVPDTVCQTVYETVWEAVFALLQRGDEIPVKREIFGNRQDKRHQ
jgi:hypothetical protein